MRRCATACARRIRIEAELREALREGHLRVFYQPVVRRRDGRLVGFEALVRWEHPVRGLIPPDAFIPVAEDCGLIVDVGSFVLDEACRQLVAWREDGMVAGDVGVAVNVSARQLALPGFAAEVASVLARHGLQSSPRLLGLEITESLLMESGAPAAATLAALAALGVGLLLDDFGTGASSLARLKRFPVDTLKIDRAFITGLGAGSEADDAIVAAIVALAGKLNLRVVAEGVETPEQLDILASSAATASRATSSRGRSRRETWSPSCSAAAR
jgi:EAL domain-containing protein (putative c-di-GMP-specific phosphodiesterase class I)